MTIENMWAKNNPSFKIISRGFRKMYDDLEKMLVELKKTLKKKHFQPINLYSTFQIQQHG